MGQAAIVVEAPAVSSVPRAARTGAACVRPLPPLHVTPVLRVDTAQIAADYRTLAAALPRVALHYAIKANPAAAVLRTLLDLGARWDVASPGEIDAVLAIGGDPADLSYGNTIKRAADIAYAFGCGVRQFTVDSPGELTKIITLAPGATVLVRIATSGAGRRLGARREVRLPGTRSRRPAPDGRRGRASGGCRLPRRHPAAEPAGLGRAAGHHRAAASGAAAARARPVRRRSGRRVPGRHARRQLPPSASTGRPSPHRSAGISVSIRRR